MFEVEFWGLILYPDLTLFHAGRGRSGFETNPELLSQKCKLGINEYYNNEFTKFSHFL